MEQNYTCHLKIQQIWKKKEKDQKKKRLESEVARCEKMLSNPGFVNKAPEKKIQEEKDKLEKYKEMLAKVIERLK